LHKDSIIRPPIEGITFSLYCLLFFILERHYNPLYTALNNRLKQSAFSKSFGRSGAVDMTWDNKKHSYADYVLEKDETYEVIGGVILNMSLSPTPKHQDVVAELTAEI